MGSYHHRKHGGSVMNNILRVISLVSFSLLLCAPYGYCVPALQVVQQLEQPDGTTFSATLWGDETSHGWETEDGYTVIKNQVTQTWHYAKTDPGTQTLMAGRVVGLSAPAASVEKHQRPNSMMNAQRSLNNASRSNPQTSQSRSISGTRPLPVLMVNFNDTATTYNAMDFENLLFGEGNNSMKDYYEEVSHGTFTITSGSAGVSGWHTASNTMAYYGANNGSGYDQHPAELVAEAVAAADGTIDFSEYDTNGDCYVDAVVIIHQGPGEEAGGSSNTIWSHRWSLSSASHWGDGDGVYTTNDVAACGQVRVNDYVIQPETLQGGIQTIGVFAHEYGHVLGLPDLYDIDYSSHGIGNWGLMSGGTWGGVSRPGDRPVHMCAWSKYVLGWIDPVTVAETRTNVVIGPVGDHGDVYQLFPDNQTDSREYYLIENRQRIGFDAGLPGTGLAIWHIDENKESWNNRDNAQECLPGSDCTDTHYRVALVQADGYADLETGHNRGDSGDLFPGAMGNNAFTTFSSPASVLYDGSLSHVSISDIAENHQNITATLALNYAITLSVTGNGRITPEGTTSIGYGETATFEIIPDDGNQLLDVYVDDVSVGAVSAYTFSDTQLDHEIRAEFTALPSSNASSGQGGSGGCFISAMTQ